MTDLSTAGPAGPEVPPSAEMERLRVEVEEWNPRTHHTPLGSDELYRLAIRILAGWRTERGLTRHTDEAIRRAETVERIRAKHGGSLWPRFRGDAGYDHLAHLWTEEQLAEAVVEALCQEGILAWDGDATRIVAQIIIAGRDEARDDALTEA